VTFPAAVLWDLDGTLVDTEPLWMAAETRLAARHGATWTEEDGLALVGSDLLDAARLIEARIRSGMTPEEIVDHLVHELGEAMRRDQPWRPGATELVGALADAGVPQALVTMSYRAIAEPVIEALPFDAVVTGDEVEHGKPHPEPYLAAARALGVDPSDCLAVEDSATGAASADAAGCVVLVVPHMVPVPEGPRRVRRDSLAGLDPAGLGALWASA
jgi:HAD superfamily hydrolase (TIGR01509 family)